jgi:hypothetical protein
MSEENALKGQVETESAVAENLLTYADLLQLEWVFADKIDEWIWRNDGETDDSIEKSRATLERIREMIRLDELTDQAGAAHPVKLTLPIPAQTYAAAEQLTRSRCLQSLPQTLVDLASDMGECVTGPGSWEAEAVRGWMESRYLPLEVLRTTQEGAQN